MMKNYSMELANGVKAFLDEDDWKYSFDKEKGMFRFGLKIKSRLSQIQYMVRVHEKHITFYGIAPVSPDHEDEKMMGQMAEFICKAHYGLKNGCFEMDYNDGEIRYKSYVDCDGIIPSQKVIENSIYCIANMYETYAPGIIDILFKDVPAKEAIEKCEDGRRRLRELLQARTGNTDALLDILQRKLAEMEAPRVDIGEDTADADDEDHDEIEYDVMEDDEDYAFEDDEDDESDEDEMEDDEFDDDEGGED